MDKKQQDNIVMASLACAQKRDWAYVSLADIAREAKIDLADLRHVIDEKFDCVRLIHGYVDRVMLSDIGKTADTDSMEQLKDRLFDILMSRFDALQDKREAYRSIAMACKQDPTAWLRCGLLVRETLSWALSAAGFDMSRPMRCKVAISLLSVVYLNTARVWHNDDSADMSATMAVLDQGLDKVMRYIS